MPKKKKVATSASDLIAAGDRVAVVLDESRPGTFISAVKPPAEIENWISAITISADDRVARRRVEQRTHAGFGVWPRPSASGRGVVVPMRIEFTYGQSDDPVEVVFDMDGGLVGRYTFSVHGETIVPGRLTVESSGTDPADDPLRRLDDGPTVRRQLEQWLRHPLVAGLLGRPLVVAHRRPGRRGSDPLVYATWAARYVAALRVDERRPAREMVRQLTERGEYVTLKQVTNAVHRARRLGMLTPTPAGRAGGQLTARAVELLQAAGLTELIPKEDD